jgi:hypothetical protein
VLVHYRRPTLSSILCRSTQPPLAALDAAGVPHGLARGTYLMVPIA